MRRRRTARQQFGFWVRFIGYFPCFFAVMTLLMFAVYFPPALSAQRTDAQLRQDGATTVGEVVAIDLGSTPHGRYSSGSTTYYPVTEQLIGGTVVSKSWDDYASTRADRWTVGQQLAVRFDPAKSKRMSIDTPEASALLAGKVANYMLQLKVAAAAAVVGPAILLAAHRLDPQRRRKRRRNPASA